MYACVCLNRFRRWFAAQGALLRANFACPTRSREGAFPTEQLRVVESQPKPALAEGKGTPETHANYVLV